MKCNIYIRKIAWNLNLAMSNCIDQNIINNIFRLSFTSSYYNNIMKDVNNY